MSKSFYPHVPWFRYFFSSKSCAREKRFSLHFSVPQFCLILIFEVFLLCFSLLLSLFTKISRFFSMASNFYLTRHQSTLEKTRWTLWRQTADELRIQTVQDEMGPINSFKTELILATLSHSHLRHKTLENYSIPPTESLFWVLSAIYSYKSKLYSNLLPLSCKICLLHLSCMSGCFFLGKLNLKRSAWTVCESKMKKCEANTTPRLNYSLNRVRTFALVRFSSVIPKSFECFHRFVCTPAVIRKNTGMCV